MTISLVFRGDIQSKDAHATVQWLKQNKKCTFVEWYPTEFKIDLNEQPPAGLEDDSMVTTPRFAVNFDW